MKKFNTFLTNLKTKTVNFFKKLKPKEKEKTEVNKTKQEGYVKFKTNRFPRLFIHTKHRLVKGLLITMPIIIAVLGITFGILASQSNSPYTVEVELIEEESNYRVYLLSNDNLVVPVSLKGEERLNKAEVLLDVFNNLKDDKTYENNQIKGFIPKDTKVREMELIDGHLMLDLTEEFMQIEPNNTFRGIEALTQSFLSVEGVDSLSIRIDGCLVDKFANGVRLPLVLDHSIGINRFMGSLGDQIGTEEVVMLYNKTINNQKFYVPVSVNAKKGDNKVETIYNAIDLNPSIVRGLSKVKEYEMINKNNKPVTQDNLVAIEVNQSALIDEVTMSKDLYDLLSLTFAYTDLNYRVSLTLDGESYAVDGIIDEDTYEVSSIIYNEVEL